MKRIASLLLTLLLGIVFLLPANEAAAASPTEVINVAKKYLGTPYRYGGMSPTGFDCSGFVSYSYKKIGVNLPHSADAMFQRGKKVSKTNLKPGDLVFFNTGSKKVSHVAIYIGNNKVIHSVSNGVKIDCLNCTYWKTRYIGAKRI
ncbi:peptidase P60 [Heyndrickxia shackletonii]|uniref:Peptidase P60 n=1 Tax=Heyndrickxia shackletonii TaxID=157838 RepID=A0A0Q3WRG1_9BACI|nr:C40 family peptidase [Heyndrickxia shackletonii]KQL50671.1 peptidase P60 [Heyndrickxia shackletonii]NEY98000.1 C40 family peptidase [Heyndrickxia shackletonii]